MFFRLESMDYSRFGIRTESGEKIDRVLESLEVGFGWGSTWLCLTELSAIYCI